MMSSPETQLDFGEIVPLLRCGEVWQIAAAQQSHCADIARQAFDALQQPRDFPPLESAIVPGDRVALAVDPNIPRIAEVIQGLVKAIGLTDAATIDIVLGDEATATTIDSIREVAGDDAHVIVHRCSDRHSLRYLGADEAADPIYLSRWLVDADLVLPVVAGGTTEVDCQADVSGVFPAFADSASRIRHQSDRSQAGDSRLTWMLGVHLMVVVVPGTAGHVADVLAGTPETIRRWQSGRPVDPPATSAQAPLVVAALEGDSQQQTWTNAARAVSAAVRCTEPGGVIVLWSAIDTELPQRLLGSLEVPGPVVVDEPNDDGFPSWDESAVAAQTLRRVSEDFRLLIHSRLDDEIVESAGFGAVATTEQLARLSEGFAACGVVRVAQFASPASTHRSQH